MWEKGSKIGNFRKCWTLENGKLNLGKWTILHVENEHRTLEISENEKLNVFTHEPQAVDIGAGHLYKSWTSPVMTLQVIHERAYSRASA